MEGVKREKKNYLAGLAVTLMWWGVLAGMIFGVEPERVANFLIPNSYIGFFGVVFLAVFFTMSLVLGSSRRGLLVALAVVIWGYLRLWRISNWLNTLLLAGLVTTMEIYFWGKSERRESVIE